MLRWRPRHRHDHRTHRQLNTRRSASANATVTGAVAALLACGVLSACDRSAPGDATTDQPAPPGTVSTGVEPNAVIDFVVDGDTVDVLIGQQEERVRLIGIDTPETKRPDTPIECFGPEASARTAELLPPGTSVRLERDAVGRDDFGRLLAYVYRADDGLFVNELLVREGFATPLSIEPNTTFADVFVAAARAAEADDIGLWAACGE